MKSVSEHHGKCLCDAVRVTATPKSMSIDACHCVMCQNWGGWVAFALGGALIVFVCLLTVSKLNAETVNSVLMPGILSGMVLLIGGYWTQYMSRKAENDKVLAGILRKLLD